MALDIMLRELHRLQGPSPGTVTPDVALIFVHAANGSRHIVGVALFWCTKEFNKFVWPSPQKHRLTVYRGL